MNRPSPSILPGYAVRWTMTAVAASLGLLAIAAAPAAAAPCASLVDLDLPRTTITSAEVVPAGALTPPGTNAALEIRSICRVT